MGQYRIATSGTEHASLDDLFRSTEPLAARSNTMAAGTYLSLGGQNHTQPALTTAPVPGDMVVGGITPTKTEFPGRTEMII